MVKFSQVFSSSTSSQNMSVCLSMTSTLTVPSIHTSDRDKYAQTLLCITKQPSEGPIENFSWVQPPCGVSVPGYNPSVQLLKKVLANISLKNEEVNLAAYAVERRKPFFEIGAT